MKRNGLVVSFLGILIGPAANIALGMESSITLWHARGSYNPNRCLIFIDSNSWQKESLSSQQFSIKYGNIKQMNEQLLTDKDIILQSPESKVLIEHPRWPLIGYLVDRESLSHPLYIVFRNDTGIYTVTNYIEDYENSTCTESIEERRNFTRLNSIPTYVVSEPFFLPAHYRINKKNCLITLGIIGAVGIGAQWLYSKLRS